MFGIDIQSIIIDKKKILAKSNIFQVLKNQFIYFGLLFSFLAIILLPIVEMMPHVTHRHLEIGEASNVPSYIVANKESLKLEWLKKAKSVGISAGASAPEVLVDELIESLKIEFDLSLEILDGQEEKVFFPLPDRLNS